VKETTKGISVYIVHGMEVQLNRILKHLNWKEICWLLLKKKTESKQ